MNFHRSVPSDAEQLREARHQHDPEDHPDIEVLYSYNRGSLPAQQADLIQEHLAGCPSCARLFLGLVNFLEWDLDPERLTPQELAPSWERFLERKRAEEEAARERELCPMTPG